METLKCKISSEAFNELLNANIDSLKCIMLLDSVELQNKTGLSQADAVQIIQESSKILVEHKIKTGLDYAKWARLSTGCETIDATLNGGFPASGISEIFGVAGTGKTQLCLQLSLMVQFPGNLGGAFYISTEDVFPSRRLHSLANALPKKYNARNLNYEDNIYVEHIADYEQLRRCLYVRLPNLLAKVAIGLIIIDSIGGAFRSETTNVDYVKRSEELYSIAIKLLELVRKYNLVVICTNQVAENPETGRTESCLGYAWSNLVTSRFKISRVTNSNVRSFQIINTPDLPSMECNFCITESGLQ